MPQHGDAPPGGFVGRFAPSPTGALHFGSLVSALASFLQARSRGGRWLVRVEDIDPPREVAGSAESILQDLDALGLHHDGEVLYQSTRHEAYREAASVLLEQGKAFWCGCSRKDLPRSGIYPGTCRDGIPSGKSPRAIRLRVDGTVRFHDEIQGEHVEDLCRSTGDFVIVRADRLPAYQLAVVVDDAFQQVSHVMRGMDLFESTARQIFLQRSLGLDTPRYAHHPLAIQPEGHKLGKRFGSRPLAGASADKTLYQALEFLGQSPPKGLPARALLDWAIGHWRTGSVPAGKGLPAPAEFLPE
jgi:glutamyl-Q tRNA(Asp) synthetase